MEESERLASYFGGQFRQLWTKGEWISWRRRSGAWEREESGLPVDKQEVQCKAQHGRHSGGDGQVALKVVLQAEKTGGR